jgi:hypothetical protein
MFYLSGATNVLLFLITRPGLLLFPRPELLEPEIELAPQGTGPAILSDTQIQHNPEPSTSAALGDEVSRINVTPSPVGSRRVSGDI